MWITLNLSTLKNTYPQKKPQMIQVCGFTKHYENHCLNTK